VLRNGTTSSIDIKDAGGTDRQMMYLGTENNLIIGLGLQSISGITKWGNGAVYIYNNSGMLSFERYPEKNADYGTVVTRLRPGGDDNCDLGGPKQRWHNIYAYNLNATYLNGTISVAGLSDRRLKKNIVSLSDIHSQLFDKLKPVQFDFIDLDDRTYYGLIAQDVEASMLELGIEIDKFSLLQHKYYINEETGELNDEYSLVYNNLIAMLIHEVQKLKKEIKTLKGE
jgi:hypothetical protein